MHFSADHPKLLSQNGRLLWQFHQKQASNDPGQEAPPSPSDGPLVLRCLNLLTGWTADYALVGFASPIGVPLALYWLDGGEDMLVMLDWQGQQGQHISQRKLKLDHWRREARWIGPVHRQYVTDIAKVDNVVVGEEAVVLVGHDPQWSWRTPSQLVLPLSPDNGKAGEELCLAGMTPLADVSSGTAENGTAIRAFFFLGRPAATENGGGGDEIEPREMTQKLFFLCGRPSLGGKGLFACPCTRITRSLHSQLLPFQEGGPTNFPPANFQHRLVSQKAGTRLAAVLFWRPIGRQMVEWSLGCLDTAELRWHGPLAEWQSPEGEMAEAEISRDGGVLVLYQWDGGQKKEAQSTKIRSFRLSSGSRRPTPLSLTDSILLSIQCSPSSHQLKSDCLQLLGQLRRFDFFH